MKATVTYTVDTTTHVKVIEAPFLAAQMWSDGGGYVVGYESRGGQRLRRWHGLVVWEIGIEEDQVKD